MNGGGPWEVSSRILAENELGPTYAPGWSFGQEGRARTGSIARVPSISPPLAYGGRNPLTALRDSGKIAAGCGRPVLYRARHVDIDRDGEGQNGSRSFAARIARRIIPCGTAALSVPSPPRAFVHMTRPRIGGEAVEKNVPFLDDGLSLWHGWRAA